MNILVTGGAGYIGSVVTEQLIERGYRVTVFDNLYQGHREAVHPAAQFIQSDLSDRNALRQAFSSGSFDGVMHFASYTLVNESMEKPFKYLADNVTNGLNLLQEALRMM
jgi:UDP-glucose 4-epimerase